MFDSKTANKWLRRIFLCSWIKAREFQEKSNSPFLFVFRILGILSNKVCFVDQNLIEQLTRKVFFLQQWLEAAMIGRTAGFIARWYVKLLLLISRTELWKRVCSVNNGKNWFSPGDVTFPYRSYTVFKENSDETFELLFLKKLLSVEKKFEDLSWVCRLCYLIDVIKLNVWIFLQRKRKFKLFINNIFLDESDRVW